MMSQPRPHRNVVREHAAGSGRRSMTPTRLFTHQIECIIKDKDKSRPRTQCRSSPEGELPVEDKVSGGSAPYGPSQSLVDAPLECLLEREEPSGAEDDDVEGGANSFETIVVKVESCAVVDQGAHDAKANAAMQGSDLSPVSSTPDDLDNYAQDQYSLEVKEEKEVEHLNASCPGDNESSAPQKVKTPSVKTKKSRKVSNSSPIKEKSKSSAKHRSSGSKRSSHDKFRKSEAKRSKKQSSPESSKIIHSHRSLTHSSSKTRASRSPRPPNHVMHSPADISSSRGSMSLEDQEETPLGRDRPKILPRKAVNHNLLKMTPLSKMSSSESYAAEAVSSGSDDEIIDHEKHEVCDKNMVGSSSSLNSQSDSGLTKSSSSADYISFEGSACFSSLRPETSFKVPSPQTPLTRCGSPYGSPYLLPVLQSSSSLSWLSQPPPPPPPAMRGGVFNWREYSNSPQSPLYATPAHSPYASTTPFSPLASTPILSPHASPNPSPLLTQARTMFGSSTDTDRRFQQLQNLHNPPRPNFHGYQLIGDSMLLRFSQQILGESIIMAESLRFLGYCVSGQKVGELLKRLKSGFYHVGKKVVLMIGTNDLLQNTNLDQMCQELRRVVEHLLPVVDELVVLTLPPVPRLQNLTYHWRRLNEYNDFIKQLGHRGPPKVTPVDTCSSFVDMRIPKCRMELFELTFFDSERKDLIHLNRKGLTVVKEQLYKIM